MKTTTNLLVITGVNFLILTVAFFLAGLLYTTYIGVALFLYHGYRHSQYTSNNLYSILLFLLSVLLFVVVVFIFYTHKFSIGNPIVFPPLFRFVYIVFPFVTFFTIGWLISLIRSKGLDLLLYYSLMGVVICATINHFSHSASGSLTAIFYFYSAYKLFSLNKLKWYYNYMVPSFGYLFAFLLLGELHLLTIANFLYISFAIYMAHLYVKHKITGFNISKKQKVVLVSFLFASLVYYLFLLNFTEYIKHSACKPPANKEFSESFVNMNGNRVLSSDFNGRVVVLDLWSTSCGVCMKKFPDFEEFYNNNKDNIVIYAIGLKVRWQENEDLEKVIKKLNYNFPFLIAEKGFEHYRERYSITGVPSIIILDKEGNIVYNNDMNTNPLIRVHNLQKMVDKLVRESQY